MEITKAACASCGAPLPVHEKTNEIICNYCGASMVVERTGNQVTLIMGEEIEKTIKETGSRTAAEIRESSQTTQLELKRLQMQQQIASLENQLSRVKSEIRGLESIKRNSKQKKQLKELEQEKESLIYRIKLLENQVYPVDPQQGQGTPPRFQDFKPKARSGGCLTGIIVFFIFSFIFMGIGTTIDTAIYGDAEGAPIPFSTIGFLIASTAGILGYIYKNSPNSRVTLWMKEKLFRIKKAD